MAASGGMFGRRSSIGFDVGRLNMIIAVLEKCTGLSLTNRDIYVNVAGGIKPEGTGADLAAAIAIYSAATGKPVSDKHMIVIGELGLTGELRGVPQPERIAGEAARMGFDKMLIPMKNREKWSGGEIIKVLGAGNILDAVKLSLHD